MVQKRSRTNGGSVLKMEITMKETENFKSTTDIKPLNRPIDSVKCQISVSEIKYLMNRIREINANKIINIDFLDDEGLPIKIEAKNINEWKYTGLNITDFIDSDFYKKGFK